MKKIDKSVDIKKDNNGNIITGDSNIIIQFFSDKELKINKKAIPIVSFLLLIVITWNFIENNETDKKIIMEHQQLRGNITDMIGNPIQGIKVILPNGESNRSNENGEYIFYDVLANENNTIKVSFEYNKNQYENPDKNNNNNQQLGLEYNLVQLRRLD